MQRTFTVHSVQAVDLKVQNKAGGGMLLYYRQSLHITRRTDLEISEFETVRAEITLPNSKPFLICSVYRPPDACSSWIDLFDNEITKAQTTSLELILMGDFNIDYSSSCNNKWNNLVQLFDLSQLVSKLIRVTASTTTIIDHVYTTHKGNITECFVPHYAISDHYPVCFTRKIDHKIRKSTHITATYRCFKNFNEEAFLSDLGTKLESFELHDTTADHDFSILHSIITNELDKYAPVGQRRVKSLHLPDWNTPEIGQSRETRDKLKHSNNWTEYKRFRNKTSKLIKTAKRKHFTDLIENSKDTKLIWKHLRTINDPASTKNRILPD